MILFTAFAKCRIWEQTFRKLPVMPQNKRDVLTLLAATEEMVTDYADRPIITMSMAGTGVISRLCGEVFGSSMTFGAAKKASAPGQMGVDRSGNRIARLATHKAYDNDRKQARTARSCQDACWQIRVVSRNKRMRGCMAMKRAITLAG